ncbi:MAG: hypothetical protein ABI921_02860 [Panacibacter sp.]
MKKVIIIIILFLNTNYLFSQKIEAEVIKKRNAAISAAISSKTGNTKDVLPNMYQLALRNIFNKNGELSFSSTVFGLLDSINSKVEIDTVFAKLSWARNISFNISGKLDSSNSKIESYGGGIKVSIINRRDPTRKDDMFNTLMKHYLSEINTTFSKARTIIAERNASDTIKQAQRLNDIFNSRNKFNDSHDLNDLDQELRSVISNELGISDLSNIFSKPFQEFDDWKKSLEKKPLWTFNYNLYHNTATKKDTSAFQTDFVVGFRLRKDKEDEKLWELNLSSYLKLCKTTDSTNKTSSLFHFEAGLNKVLSTDEDKKSQMELKLFGSYDKDFAVDNRKGIFTANITYRYRAFKDFWIPVSLKYDPKNGNVFGYLTFALNLDKY